MSDLPPIESSLAILASPIGVIDPWGRVQYGWYPNHPAVEEVVSEQELLEELAGRMYGAAFDMSGMLREKAWKARGPDPHYLRLARECLRQIEWNRYYAAGPGAEVDGPIAIAPDGWRPGDTPSLAEINESFMRKS